MRKLFIILSVSIILFSCGKKKSEKFTNFGLPINKTEFITPKKLISQKDNLNWREVAVKGEISSVCVNSGNRISFKVNDSTEVNVSSMNDDKPFVFPKECVGKNAEVVGVFQIKEGFTEHLHDEDAEHSEDAKHDENEKEEQHHKSDGKVYIIKATGVNIYGL